MLYLPCEIHEIARVFNRYGVHLNGLHASTGRLRFCWSPRAWEREGGFALVVNRMEMTAELGGDGTLDGPRLARLVAASPCRDNINLEAAMRTYGDMAASDFVVR